MEAVPGFGPRAYTDKAYGIFREALVDRAVGRRVIQNDAALYIFLATLYRKYTGAR